MAPWLTSIEMEAAAAAAPSLSVAVSVIVWVPRVRDNTSVLNCVPVQIAPSRLLNHAKDPPVSVPSSVSVAVPRKVTDSAS